MAVMIVGAVTLLELKIGSISMDLDIDMAIFGPGPGFSVSLWTGNTFQNVLQPALSNRNPNVLREGKTHLLKGSGEPRCDEHMDYAE
ncbi:hypothetical protein [Dictyobacter alpinus]|nr:hypothetical protein [Dictyobacter alpinus]